MRKMFLVVAAALASAACSSGGGDDSPPAPPTGSLQLVNGTSTYIDEVYVSKSTDIAWGAQRNGSSIPASSSFTVSGLEPVLWDLMAVYWGTYSDYFTYAWDQPITAGETRTVTAYASGFTGSAEIVNSDFYSRSMINLYFRPVGYAWGSDWLGSSTLYYDWSYEIQELTPGYYDVWCEFSDGYDDIAYSVSVSSRSLTVVNCGA